jgi:hypothetical protein
LKHNLKHQIANLPKKKKKKHLIIWKIYPWVVPLGMSHPKLLKPIQLQNNMELALKKKIIPNYLSKGYPNRVEFKTLIKFTEICVLI